MSNILRSDLKHLLGAIATSTLRNGQHSLYLGINGTAPWADELAPPSPSDTAFEQREFWNHLTGFLRIPSTNIWACLRNNRWIKGKTFEMYDVNKPTRKQYRYYCTNSEYEVYECVSIILNAGEYPFAVNEPKGHNNGNVIDTMDGYQWRYRYQVKREDMEFKVTDDWIPVYNPINDILPQNQILYGMEQSEHLSNIHHMACYYELTENSVFKAQPDYIPHYRQFGLFIDILNSSDMSIATDAVLLPQDVMLESGYIIYTENIKKTMFSATMTDTIQIVVEL